MRYLTLLKKLKEKHDEAKENYLDYQRTVYVMPMEEVFTVIGALKKVTRKEKGNAGSQAKD